MKIDSLLLWRLSRAAARCGLHPIARLFWAAQFPIFGSSIPPSVTIGKGTVVGYRGLGIVIHERAVVGCDCLISHQVTIGGRTGAEKVPILGDGVYVGVGAKLLGPITIGNHAKIGANAVVIADVPSGATAVGIPARVIEGSPPLGDTLG